MKSSLSFFSFIDTDYHFYPVYFSDKGIPAASFLKRQTSEVFI